MLAAIPWYVYLLFLGAVGLPMAYMWAGALREERTLARAGLSHVRRMAWPEFLRYLEALFAGLGYQVERTPSRNDYGADLLLKDGTGRRTAVNARHFKERVGPEALQEVAEGAQYHDCEDTLVVSAVGFTNKAIDASEENGTILWDAGDLADAAEKVRIRPSFQPREAHRPGAVPPAAGSHIAASLQAAATREIPLPPADPQAAPQGPPCPVCGKPMEPKVAAGREIWLCSRFPRCNGAELRETGGTNG
ncbi:MAG TPA: restriction endonuclease [Symbiobacteriaceae bacterium]|nr:restriction endonuclease [Symbiobacteriaceae bacterium]